ncbi:MAG: hypothetical protein VB013_05680 [Anaerolineaceae bacterium]|nr:hypothetical protein [Anaerolineaceae bacterium]
MTLQVSIPAKAILELSNKSLELDFPPRCSRCNAPDAPFFESHPLHYRADLMPNRTVAHRYRINRSFSLRLPLCETCYRANFIEDPESLTADDTPLGKLARVRSACIKIAAGIALVGFVLLMGIIPLTTLPFLWLYVILVGVGLLAIVFGATALMGKRMRSTLPGNDYNIRYPRAIVYEAIETEKPAPGKTAVFLRLKNETWARECAEKHHWKTGSTDSPSEKESENESSSDR